MKKTLLSGLIVFLVSLSLAGCGGGGDSSGAAATVQATKAMLTLSTQGTVPPSTQIGGIEVTVNLPAGVTVKASPSPSNAAILVTDANVVTAVGSAAGAEVVQATAAANTPSAVTIMIAKSGGFPAGDFAFVSCDIASGVTTTPAAADFSLTNFKAVDLNGQPLTGLTPGFTAAIQ